MAARRGRQARVPDEEVPRSALLADGAQVLWDLKKEFFPQARECLDWFHAVEKLWDAGKAICRGTRRERNKLEAWVAKRKKAHRAGRVHDVLSELIATLDATAVTGPGNKYRSDVLDRVINHFAENAGRMRYRQLRSQDPSPSAAASSKVPCATSSAFDSTDLACVGGATAPRPSSIYAASSSTGSGPTSKRSSLRAPASAFADDPSPRELMTRNP